MTALPATITKTLPRRRVQILRTGDIYKQWGEWDKEGTIYVDAHGHAQYKAGEYRFIIEIETRTITYTVEA